MTTRALVVDDSRTTADSLVSMLRVIDVEATACYGPRDALLAVRKYKPDVIFLDVNMPGISGLEVLRFLRREPTTSDLPIVIVSSEAQTDEIERALLKGANIFLSKPVTVDQLEMALQELLGEQGNGA